MSIITKSHVLRRYWHTKPEDTITNLINTALMIGPTALNVDIGDIISLETNADEGDN